MASVQGVEGDLATVDHSDMRGLVTDLTSLRRGAALLYSRGSVLLEEGYFEARIRRIRGVYAERRAALIVGAD